MKRIRIGTSEKGGTFWTEGEAIATLLERDCGIASDILDAEQASIENARRLDSRLIEFGFMASNWIGRAYRGDAPFEGPVGSEWLWQQILGRCFYRPRRSGAKKRSGPHRKTGVDRTRRQRDGSTHSHHVWRPRYSFDDFTPVYLSFEDGGKALEAGDVDAQWQCPYPNVVMREISERMDVCVLEYDSRSRGDTELCRLLPADDDAVRLFQGS